MSTTTEKITDYGNGTKSSVNVTLPSDNEPAAPLCAGLSEGEPVMPDATLTPADLRALVDLMERLNDPDIVIGRDGHERPTAGCTLARATVLLDADRWVTIKLAGGHWRLQGVEQASPA